MTALHDQLENVRAAIADLGDCDELRVRVFEEWRGRDVLVASTSTVARDVVLCGLRAMEAQLVELVEQEVTA